MCRECRTEICQSDPDAEEQKDDIILRKLARESPRLVIVIAEANISSAKVESRESISEKELIDCKMVIRTELDETKISVFPL